MFGSAKSNKQPGFISIPKSAMVTGGSGFVGQRLVEMLVERGYVVVSKDNNIYNKCISEYMYKYLNEYECECEWYVDGSTD